MADQDRGNQDRGNQQNSTNMNAGMNAGGNQNTSGGNSSSRRNPADNLTHQDRVRGGERSAQLQNRDQRGQFAGRKKQEGDAGNRSSGGRTS